MRYTGRRSALSWSPQVCRHSISIRNHCPPPRPAPPRPCRVCSTYEWSAISADRDPSSRTPAARLNKWMADQTDNGSRETGRFERRPMEGAHYCRRKVASRPIGGRLPVGRSVVLCETAVGKMSANSNVSTSLGLSRSVSSLSSIISRSARVVSTYSARRLTPGRCRPKTERRYWHRGGAVGGGESRRAARFAAGGLYNRTAINGQSFVSL